MIKTPQKAILDEKSIYIEHCFVHLFTNQNHY